MSNIDKNYEDFLKSLQEDNGAAQESFPFNEDFDIENFIKTTEEPTREPVQLSTPEPQMKAAPVKTAPAKPTPPTAEQINKAKESEFSLSNDEGKQINFDTAEDKNYSIKRLEEKLSDLQQRFNEANAIKEEESAFASELNKHDEEEIKAEPVKSDEEFFSNISSAIQTLKGSLDNIVNTRLRYEENLIRQDQTLIARLKEKTTRLKAINLALNSEVKRSRSEKLEYLRRSAEQTKELLSLRMQLSHAEERSKQGDFKVSGLEQQIALLTQEKGLVDDEILKIRQEKLNYLQNAAEQTRNLMQLRHQLATKEEALKQEEVKTNFLEQQLKNVEAAQQALQREKQDSDIKKHETERTLLLQKDEINSLTEQLNRSKEELARKTEEATQLRQQLLNLQIERERSKNEMAAFAVRQEELLAPLKLSQQAHEQKIDSLRAEQSTELQHLRTRAFQEESLLREELQRAEAKYHQEESFVNSLKIQIQDLANNLRSLEMEKADYKNKSDNLAKELDSIKENNQNELANLKETLQKAQNSYERQQELYNNLETQYKNAQREKYYLSEEIKKIIVQKDNALLQNQRYLSEIEKLKSSQNDLTKDLKQEIQNLLAKRDQLTQELNSLKQKPSIPVAQVQQTQNNLQENNTALEILKTQMATLLSSKGNIDKELLEAREEKLKLLNKLEDQTKQLNAFQINYQNEIAALTQEKAKAKLEAEAKIRNLEDKVQEDQETISYLNKQLQDAKEELLSHPTEDEKLIKERQKTQELSQELEKARKMFSQDTALLEEMKNQHSKLQDRNEILEQELAKVQEENKQIEKERQDYKNQAEELRKQLNDVKAELARGQEFTKQLSEQINKLKTVNNTLNTALQQMQQQKIAALNTTAKQAQEILELKSQLQHLQTDLKSLKFQQGTVTVSAEHQAKIKGLEEELKRVSEVCMTQTKEINNIKTDNLRLKNVAEEKLLLQNRFNALQKNLTLMTAELNIYKDGDKANALNRAKATALIVQLERVNKEKDSLKHQLEATQIELQAATERERKTSQELDALRQALKQNEDNISRLKKEIAPLTGKANSPAEENRPRVPVVVSAPVKEELTDDVAEDAAEDTKTDLKEKTETETFTKKTEPLSAVIKTPEKAKAQPQKEGTTNILQQRDILADYDRDEKGDRDQDEEPMSFLENTIPLQTVEEVYLPGKEMDLESIFQDDNPDKPTRELTQEDRQVVIEEIKPTNVGDELAPVKTARERIDEDLQVAPSENTYTDHSIRRSVISRRPYARNPLTTFRKDEEYSDFLKKTKSLFYRIKWSLFKD